MKLTIDAMSDNFDMLNSKLFNDKLHKKYFSFGINNSRKTLGICIYSCEYEKGLRIYTKLNNGIRIEMSKKYDWNQKEFLDTLAHEMIHGFNAQYNNFSIDKDGRYDAHGTYFEEWMKRINVNFPEFTIWKTYSGLMRKKPKNINTLIPVLVFDYKGESKYQPFTTKTLKKITSITSFIERQLFNMSQHTNNIKVYLIPLKELDGTQWQPKKYFDTLTFKLYNTRNEGEFSKTFQNNFFNSYDSSLFEGMQGDGLQIIINIIITDMITYLLNKNHKIVGDVSKYISDDSILAKIPKLQSRVRKVIPCFVLNIFSNDGKYQTQRFYSFSSSFNNEKVVGQMIEYMKDIYYDLKLKHGDIDMTLVLIDDHQYDNLIGGSFKPIKLTKRTNITPSKYARIDDKHNQKLLDIGYTLFTVSNEDDVSDLSMGYIFNKIKDLKIIKK